MPFVNVKLVKDQVSLETKRQILFELTELIVRVMNRDRSLTNIVVDVIDPTSWALGGKEVNPAVDFVSFVNIKVSKGSTNSEEMAIMLKETPKLMANILGNHIAENYFIIDELNPSAWGFDGISMTKRATLEGV